MQLIIFFLFQCICFHQYSEASWVGLKPLRRPSLDIFEDNLERIDLAKNGRRVAIGSTHNSITIYDLATVPAHNDSSPTAWISTAHLSGVSGVHFSLSPDGRFLASRHHSIAKQVQVWEISNGDSHDEDSETYKEEYSSSGTDASEPSRSPENVERIGTFWCVSDGQSVKLGQTRSKLYLVMSCETWFSNRGKVQVFVRDMSEPSNNSSTWDDFFPSLEGRNDGDRFGTALSIAEAPSHYSGYEFRLAVSSPGYNCNQGLVRIYTASYTSNGWDQMGDDLVGSEIGERFGATLDMSDNINDQPFLIVGSPGWKGATDSLSLTQSDDFTSDKGSLESLGIGLVRLYHWRKTASTFRGPRRWTLVGKPMSGRNFGDQFGSALKISRTGERIAIAASSITNNNKKSDEIHHRGGYLGVYERESFYSWGKVVNDVIMYDRFSCEKINQCLELNDSGSMIMIALSNGKVETFIDESPFCSLSATTKVQTNVNDESSSIHSNLQTLLDRQTCRKSGDTLVDTRNFCSEQLVYMKGEYRACSWQNKSITYSSPNPKAINSSISPSISPSLSSPEAIPGTPSIVPWEPILLEPSLVPSLLPKSPANSSLAPSYRPLQEPTDKMREPSVISNDEEKPILMSAVPTSTVLQNPLLNPTSPQPSFGQDIDPSLSPTGQPPSQIERDERIFDQEGPRHLKGVGIISFILLAFVLLCCCWFGKRQLRTKHNAKSSLKNVVQSLPLSNAAG